MIPIPLRTALAISLPIAVLGGALAQGEISGTLSGAVDGEASFWTTYSDVVGGRLVNTATWIEPMAGMPIRSFTIVGQTREAIFSVTEGGIIVAADFVTPTDPGNPLAIEGTFDIARMTREPEGE